MKLSLENLNYVLFENEDAKLLIEKVLEDTDAVIFYFDGVEISIESAIKIWTNAHCYYPYKASIHDGNASSKLCS